MALLAVLVLGVGSVLVPRNTGKPQAVPFSQTARTEALDSTEDLVRSATLLEPAAGRGAGSETDSGDLAATVTLLTTQSRALLPDSAPSPSSSMKSSGTASTAPSSPAASPEHPTRESFVAALASSASRRLADAGKADGGIARLLAAVGTSQLLESSRLATAWGLPQPTATVEAVPAPTAFPSCPPQPEASAAATPATGSGSRADLPNALAAVVSSEQEAVYAYQVAVTKLDAKSSATAATWLARHQELLRAAEDQGRLHCVVTPPREAGYRLPVTFQSKPAAALGSMEASSLEAYADLVALSDGTTRQWALGVLLETAKRSEAWGTQPGPFAGLPVDDAELPPLPTSTPAP